MARLILYPPNSTEKRLWICTKTWDSTTGCAEHKHKITISLGCIIIFRPCELKEKTLTLECYEVLRWTSQKCLHFESRHLCSMEDKIILKSWKGSVRSRGHWKAASLFIHIHQHLRSSGLATLEYVKRDSSLCKLFRFSLKCLCKFVFLEP